MKTRMLKVFLHVICVILPAMFLLAGCAQAIATTQPVCHFDYNSDFAKHVVVPVLKAKYGERYTLFNLKDPAIFNKKNYVRLVFGQSKPEEGYMPMDTANFVLIIDPCTSHVIKSFETSSSPSTR